MKRGDRLATRPMILKAIEKHNTFEAIPGVVREIVLPEANPGPRKHRERKHRAYILRCDTGETVITAESTYELLDKLNGPPPWKYDPDKKEGLFE